MLQHIEETCTLGAHAAVIVPPTWIIRVRRQQVQTQPFPYCSACYIHTVQHLVLCWEFLLAEHCIFFLAFS